MIGILTSETFSTGPSRRFRWKWRIFQPRRRNRRAAFDVEDEFEPDAEMLEVFAMEAEDLLSNIETILDALVKTPADRDPLWEIRRNAHTFKGAAGIIGLKAPSALAHRMEDLLDHLAAEGDRSRRGVLDLIRLRPSAFAPWLPATGARGRPPDQRTIQGIRELLAELTNPSRPVKTRPAKKL